MRGGRAVETRQPLTLTNPSAYAAATSAVTSPSAEAAEMADESDMVAEKVVGVKESRILIVSSSNYLAKLVDRESSHNPVTGYDTVRNRDWCGRTTRRTPHRTTKVVPAA